MYLLVLLHNIQTINILINNVIINSYIPTTRLSLKAAVRFPKLEIIIACEHVTVVDIIFYLLLILQAKY